MIKPHARDYAERRKDFDITGETSPLDKNTSKDFSKKRIEIVKEIRTVVDIHNAESSNFDYYSNSIQAPIITADKLDILIMRQLLKDPYIQTLEISINLGIPLPIVHKKRRLIESNVLHTRYSLNLDKLGLHLRFPDVFADIKEDKVDDFVNQMYPSSFVKNIHKLIRIKTQSDGICIKAIYQNSDELFFLMDKVKSYPFISNVHFSEEIEVLADNTLDVILTILNRDSRYRNKY